MFLVLRNLDIVACVGMVFVCVIVPVHSQQQQQQQHMNPFDIEAMKWRRLQIQKVSAQEEI